VWRAKTRGNAGSPRREFKQFSRAQEHRALQKKPAAEGKAIPKPCPRLRDKKDQLFDDERIPHGA
jgi:hypothetical protein